MEKNPLTVQIPKEVLCFFYRPVLPSLHLSCGTPNTLQDIFHQDISHLDFHTWTPTLAFNLFNRARKTLNTVTLIVYYTLIETFMSLYKG